MSPKISVIVPIYNVENYLQRCIDSILNQTLRDIEVILVDDGSTDNSGIIIDEYAKLDTRIIIVHKENGGQASARNIGIEIAKGQYVGFVDSDDWVDVDMYQKMYDKISETKSDMCVCGRTAYSNNYEVRNRLAFDDGIFDFNNYEKQSYVTDWLFYKHTVSSCNKIYRLDLIKEQNLNFKDVNYVGSEDALFNYCFILLANRVCSMRESFYNNLERIGSTTRSYNQGYMKRTSNLIQVMHEYSVSVGAIDLAKDIIPMFVLFFFQWNISQIKLYSENHRKDLKEELIDAGRNCIFMTYVKILYSSKKINKYIEKLGFRNKGILLVKLEMLLYSLKQYSFVSRIILGF